MDRIMARVRVVLNHPESASNVGAVARVVANTGIEGLDLVQPCDFRTVECWRMAWRSEDILEQVREFESLETACAGAVYVAGFAGRAGTRVEPITPRQMASEIAALGENDPAAIVFGCESRGLTEEELGLCHRRVRIPSHPRQPSLNLAQAVMIAGYEIFFASALPSSKSVERATASEAARALEALRDALLEIEFLPRDNPEARFVEWRELFGRAGLTSRETRVVLALARRIQNVGRIAKANRAREISPAREGSD
jgi:TrmH family RNA methyltransferase